MCFDGRQKMNRSSKSKSKRWAVAIAALLALNTLLFTFSREFIEPQRDDLASDPSSPVRSLGTRNARHASQPGLAIAAKLAERGDIPRRVAKGRITEVNSAWGIAVVEDLDGRPQVGDEAYVGHAGPDGSFHAR